MDIYYTCTRVFLRLFFNSFYHLRVIGIENIYKGGAFIACNHASYLDPPLLSVAWPERLDFLAEEPLFRNPLFGYYIRKLHAHPVHRSLQDLSTFKLLKKLLDNGHKVIFFPEGHRSFAGDLQPFQTGLAKLAIKFNRPIIPAYINGTYQAWPRHKRWPKFGEDLSCAFGEPIFPESYKNLPRKEAIDALTKNLHQSIESLRVLLMDKGTSRREKNGR